MFRQILEVQENNEMDFSKIVANYDKKKFGDHPEVPPLEYG